MRHALISSTHFPRSPWANMLVYKLRAIIIIDTHPYTGLVRSVFVRTAQVIRLVPDDVRSLRQRVDCRLEEPNIVCAEERLEHGSFLDRPFHAVPYYFPRTGGAIRELAKLSKPGFCW